MLLESSVQWDASGTKFVRLLEKLWVWDAERAGRWITGYEGCPVDLVTFPGTENGIMGGIRSFFRDDPDSHRYVPSFRNQRIEGLWGFFNKSYSNGWINFFKDMVEARLTDLASELEVECLPFCLSELLQKILDEIREYWNTHRIRGSRHDTVKGRLASLY